MSEASAQGTPHATQLNEWPVITWTPTRLGLRACRDGTGLRVAVIGKRNHLHFDQHVAEAFFDAGTDVRHYAFNQRPAFHSVLRAGARAVAGRRGADWGDARHAEALAVELSTFRPELVFFVSVFFIPPIYLQAMRALEPTPTIVGWDGDALVRFDSTRIYDGLLDMLCVTERSLVAQAAERFRRGQYLTYAANPRIYRDAGLSRSARAYFCGARTVEREAALARLGHLAITVKGPGWQGFAADASAMRVAAGKVSMQQQARDYARHLAVWNQHQQENNPEDSLNMRDFEAPASGALLVSDHRGLMDAHFDVAEELLTYRHEDELAELLERCLSDPQGSARRAARAMRRVHHEHKYLDRVQEVIAAL